MGQATQKRRKTRNEKKPKFNNRESNSKVDQINSLDLVECLSLGFWTGLFHEYYNEQIWEHHMIEKIFPFLHSSLRGFKVINKELNLIRSFRNKVFHFANILDSYKPAINQLINKFIYKLFDTNPQIYLQTFNTH